MESYNQPTPEELKANKLYKKEVERELLRRKVLLAIYTLALIIPLFAVWFAYHQVRYPREAITPELSSLPPSTEKVISDAIREEFSKAAFNRQEARYIKLAETSAEAQKQLATALEQIAIKLPAMGQPQRGITPADAVDIAARAVQSERLRNIDETLKSTQQTLNDIKNLLKPPALQPNAQLDFTVRIKPIRDSLKSARVAIDQLKKAKADSARLYRILVTLTPRAVRQEQRKLKQEQRNQSKGDQSQPSPGK